MTHGSDLLAHIHQMLEIEWDLMVNDLSQEFPQHCPVDQNDVVSTGSYDVADVRPTFVHRILAMKYHSGLTLVS